jgi:hypothetical protein
VPARDGHVEFFQCTLHGLQFELDGRRHGSRGSADLTPLDVRMMGDVILVRSPVRRPAETGVADPWADFSPPPGARLLGWPAEWAIAADWKLLMEQWLETTTQAHRDTNERGFSICAYAGLMGVDATLRWQHMFFAPNQLIESRPDGFTILQALPLAPGRTLLRRHDYSRCESQPIGRAAAYVASRLTPCARRGAIAVAESTQQGIVSFGHGAADGAPVAPAVAAFRRQLLALMPIMAQARAPNDI